MDITYKYKKASDLTDKELKDCTKLYNNNYGTYSANSPTNPNKPVRFTCNMYRNYYMQKFFYVALAYKKRKLVGHAFYLRRQLTINKKQEKVTFIVQLVVDKNQRRQGIAKYLMQSIWGFSNDYAWGLITPNIYTVRTLESTTFRKCEPRIINKNLDNISRIFKDIFFIKRSAIKVNNKSSLVNSKFFVERKLNTKEDYNDKWVLGELPDGYEWLAFTFREQNIDINKYSQHFNKIIEFSEDTLKTAYSRMRLNNHKWAKGEHEEVKYILEKIRLSNCSSILDMGCGNARHTFEFAKYGHNVIGIDFSKKHIQHARLQRKKLKIKNVRLYSSDIRTYVTEKKFDLITCLYDVVGSFPEKKDNLSIIKKAYKLLKDGGYFVISVMNFELTDKIVPESQKGDLSQNPSILMHLEPSTEMMSTGNIFKPQYLAIDTNTHLVFRKEQFTSYKNTYLPAEYVIRDKRYTKDEIERILTNEGFKIIQTSFVNAGHFSKNYLSTSPEAKEILIIAKKGSN